MGAVYEVIHRETLRRRALKVLLPSLVSDADARARFAQEASITAEIESEHLVETYDAGVDRATGCPFIVMELLRGETLGERLSRKVRHEPRDVVEMLRQVALVLEQTHRRGIIHRDLKPDNLFLSRREDGTCRVKVLDFGIAKVLERATASRNTVNIGTPLYMSPEQLDGSGLSPATDLYALTHIAFELFTGESYWETEVRTAPSTMVLLKWMDRGLPEMPSVRAKRLGVDADGELDAWFLQGTARNPAERHPSARFLVEAFARAVRIPLASFEVGRLSLAGTIPDRRDDEVVPDGSQTIPGASWTDNGTTMPRALGAVPVTLGRRSQGAFVSAVDVGRRPAPVLIAMAVGVVIALGLVGVLALFFLRSGSTPPAPAAANEHVATVDSTTASVAAETTAEATAASSAAAADSASARASTSSTSKASSRAHPTARPTTKRPGPDCQKEPHRCRR